MLIIWGSRSMDKTLGETERSYECQNCHNVSHYRIFSRKEWFTLFWIPIFPFSSTHYISCPVCNFGKKIKKQEALEQLATQPQE